VFPLHKPVDIREVISDTYLGMELKGSSHARHKTNTGRATLQRREFPKLLVESNRTDLTVLTSLTRRLEAERNDTCSRYSRETRARA